MHQFFCILAGLGISLACAIAYGFLCRPWKETEPATELRQVYLLMAATAALGTAAGSAFGQAWGLDNALSLLGAAPALFLGVRDILRCRADISDPLGGSQQLRQNVIKPDHCDIQSNCD